MHSSPRQAAGYPAKEFHEFIHIKCFQKNSKKFSGKFWIPNQPILYLYRIPKQALQVAKEKEAS